MALDSSFYERRRGQHDEERFFATESTRGPWSIDHQHAGPPAGLLARAIERCDPTDMFVVRMTCELLRPIPLVGPLEIDTEVLSSGRRVDRIAAVLRSGEDQLIVAIALRMRPRELAVPRLEHGDPARTMLGSGDPRLILAVEQSRPWDFPFFQHERGYHRAMELRVAAGEYGRGAMAAWIRPRIPLLDDEPTSPLQRVMICADAGHGVGSGLDTREFSFINPDLDVHLHRAAVDEWLCMDARSFTEPSGIGMCRTRLLDRAGEFGLAVQTQVLAAQP